MGIGQKFDGVEGLEVLVVMMACDLAATKAKRKRVVEWSSIEKMNGQTANEDEPNHAFEIHGEVDHRKRDERPIQSRLGAR